EVYDPVKNQWTFGKPTPRWEGSAPGRYDTQAAVLNSRLFLPGRWRLSPPFPASSLLVLDPGKNDWRAGSTLPAPGASHMSAAIGSKLYVLSLADKASSTGCSCYSYDPAAIKWSKLSAPNTYHIGGVSGVIEGKWNIAGGDSFDEGPTGKLDVYN